MNDGSSFRVSTKLFIIIYCVLVFIALLVNYPGQINSDVADMLWQSANVEFVTDWHSPFATLFFGLLTPIFGKPFGALILQSALMMTFPAFALAEILSAKVPLIFRAACFLVLGLITAVCVVVSGQILKDMIIVSLTSLLLYLEVRGRKTTAFGYANLLKISACAGIICVRSVSAFLFLPSTLYLLLISSTKHKFAKSLILILGSLFVAAMTPAILRDAFDARETAPQSPGEIFDIAGISTDIHQNLFKQINSTASYPDPWTCYTPERSNPYIWGDCKIYASLFLNKTRELSKLWISSIVGHPIAYVHHRLNYTLSLLHLDGRWYQIVVPLPPDFTGDTTNVARWIGTVPAKMSAGLVLWHPTISFVVFGKIAYTAFSSWLGQPTTWCMVLLASIAGSLIRNQMYGREIIAISIFGISNALLFILIGPDNAERYLLPTWFSAVADICLWVMNWSFLLARYLSVERTRNMWPAKEGQASNVPEP